jgi:hypothetical protein
MTATLPTRTAVTTCAVPGRPHQAEAGFRLCQFHFDQLADWLHDVQREFGLLETAPSFQANWGDSRGGRLASCRPPVRIVPLALIDFRHVPLTELDGSAGRDDILSVFDTLHRWANRIRAARDIRIPGHWVTEQLLPGPVCLHCSHPSCRRMVHRYFQRDPIGPKSERKFLSLHLEWAITQPWIGDLWDDIRKLVNQLQVANNTGPLHVGSCPECGGRLHIMEPRYSSGPPTTGKASWAAECDRDATHRWEGSRLIRLRLDLEEQQAARR